MIDGIYFETEIKDVEKFKANLKVSFINDIDLATGEIKPNKFGTMVTKGTFEYYNLEIKETKYKSFLHVKGSLHKNNKKGKNLERFTFDNLQKELIHLQKELGIDLKNAKIRNIEIGINLEVDFEPYDCLEKNLLNYKGSNFNPFALNKIDGSVIGFLCEKRQYNLKIYDKGKQYKVKGKNILRFEGKVFKMQCIKNYGLQNLEDLREESKVLSLKKFLQEKLAHIIFDDDEISTAKLSVKEGQILIEGRLHNSLPELRKLPTYKRQRQRNRFNRIIEVHGISYKQKLKKAIDEEWDLLFNRSAIFLPYDKG